MPKTLKRIQNPQKPTETALDSLWRAYLRATVQNAESSLKTPPASQKSPHDLSWGVLALTEYSGEGVAQSATLVQTLDYYPFGGTRIDNQESDFNEKKKFTGYEYDSSTGLNYAGARYQSPNEGQFTSQDAASRDNPGQFAADPQQMNMYSYARGNPLKYVDPNGEAAIGVGLNFGGGVPGIYGQQSVYGVISFSLNPFNLELGFVESTEGGGSTALGQVEGSAGLMFSNAKSISDLEGVDVGGGGSIKLGLAFGIDASTSKPNNYGNRVTTVTVSGGLGGTVTPYALPAEVHGGASYTKSIGSVNANQSVTNAYNTAQDSARSIYTSLQRQLNDIKSQVNALKSAIDQRFQTTSSN